jgi:hypothetical protein
MALDKNNDWQSGKKTALERNTYVFHNSLMSDITFTCGESKRKCFHVNKYVLATCSTVFESMFYGTLAEKASVIHLPDTDEDNLQEFFRFLYTENCAITPKNATTLLYLGRKYMVVSLTERCVDALDECMKPNRVLELLEEATYFDEEQLTRCWEVIDMKTNDVVSSDYFCNISHATLISLLKRETRHIKEVDLFEAVLKWSESQCSKNGVQTTDRNKKAFLKDAVYEIRFRLMTEEEFTEHAISSGLLTDEQILQIYAKFDNSSHVPIGRQEKQVEFSLPLMSYIRSWILRIFNIASNIAVLTSMIYFQLVYFVIIDHRLFYLLIIAALVAGLHLMASNSYTFPVVLVFSYLAEFAGFYLFFEGELHTTLIDAFTFVICMTVLMSLEYCKVWD